MVGVKNSGCHSPESQADTESAIFNTRLLKSSGRCHQASRLGKETEEACEESFEGFDR